MSLLTWLKKRVFGSELAYQNRINGVVTKFNNLVSPDTRPSKDLWLKLNLAKSQLTESKREFKAVLFKSFHDDLKSWVIQEVIDSGASRTSFYLRNNDVSVIIEIPSFLYKNFRNLSDVEKETASSDSKITTYKENSLMVYDFDAGDGSEITAKFFKQFYPQRLGEFELEEINAKTRDLRSISRSLLKPLVVVPEL